MNFISSLTKAAGGESADEPKKAGGEESDSKAELIASAKVLADAAQSQFNKDSAKADNKKVAEAAADVLDAAQKYGKLDESQGVGQYVEKAETYLHKYASDAPAAAPAAADEKPPVAAPAAEEPKAPAPASEPAPAPEEEKKSEGADYLKMAGDFLGKK